MSGWYGFDFDGTLAQYDHWRGANHCGKPIGVGDPNSAYELLKRLLAEGKDCRIFTARVYVPNDPSLSEDELRKRAIEAGVSRTTIDVFCLVNFGRYLPITCTKDFGMIRLYDDRCRQVDSETGRIVGDGKP